MMNKLYFFNSCFFTRLALFFAALFIFTSSLATDSTGISTTSARPMELITAYVKINVTSQNRYSWCFSRNPDDNKPDIWATSYTACPANSLVGAKTLNDVSTLVEACLCYNQCSQGVSVFNINAYAIQIAGIHCLLPVNIWVPVDVASSGGSVTLYGQTLWLSHYGTSLMLQPNQNTDEFDLTVYLTGRGDTPVLSGNYAVLKESISASSFPSYFAQFTGCVNLHNGKCF